MSKAAPTGATTQTPVYTTPGNEARSSAREGFTTPTTEEHSGSGSSTMQAGDIHQRVYGYSFRTVYTTPINEKLRSKKQPQEREHTYATRPTQPATVGRWSVSLSPRRSRAPTGQPYTRSFDYGISHLDTQFRHPPFTTAVTASSGVYTLFTASNHRVTFRVRASGASVPAYMGQTPAVNRRNPRQTTGETTAHVIPTQWER